MQFPTSDFWDFSLNLYQKPGIEPCCLSLQDEYQLDVNLVLFSCFLATSKQVLSTDQWQQLLSVSLPWQEIIKPLRQSHRLVKNAAIAWPGEFRDETRQSIGHIELNAEHMEQLSIEQCWLSFDAVRSSDASLPELIRQNIEGYLHSLNCETAVSDIEALLLVLDDALQDQDQASSQTMTL